ncbi:MAG: hypothetical protein KDD60_00020 [Bdellovibrionales bacterium]|nr:hypothetical protein [Bdellovibrionales bacterium]
MLVRTTGTGVSLFSVFLICFLSVVSKADGQEDVKDNDTAANSDFTPVEPEPIAPGLVPTWDHTSLIRGNAFIPDLRSPGLSNQRYSLDNARRETDQLGRVKYVFPDGTRHVPSWSRSRANHVYAEYFRQRVNREDRKLPMSTAAPEGAPIPLALSMQVCPMHSAGEQFFIPTTNTEQNVLPNPRPGYDYVPSIMLENGTYKIWWCSDGNTAGDRIWYMTATNLTLPSSYSAPQEVFQGSWINLPNSQIQTPNSPTPQDCQLSSAWDCYHSCDPSVIKLGSVYYMYYTGIPVGDHPDISTSIGLASSVDGITWNRYAGNPIITANDTTKRLVIDDLDIDDDNDFTDMVNLPLYGVGHPSVTLKGGMIYLTIHDDSVDQNTDLMDSGMTNTTDPSQYWCDEDLDGILDAGESLNKISEYLETPNNLDPPCSPKYMGFSYSQYAIRSRDVSFQTGVEEWSNQSGGWNPLANGQQPTREEPYICNLASVDWAYSAPTKSFVMTANSVDLDGDLTDHGTHTSVRFFDEDLRDLNSDTLHGEATWTEGPGVATTPNKQMLLSVDCGLYVFDLLRSIGAFSARDLWELSYVGWNTGTGLTHCPKHKYDYDGDGKGDTVIYSDGSPGLLHINDSTGAPFSYNLGDVGDAPILGDFDGDGLMDRGVVRPDQSISGYIDWQWHSSASGQIITIPTWGLTTDKIAIGDYDGDRRDDYGIYRPSTYEWWILPANGDPGYSVVWGAPNARPVPEDYDGDGIDDITYFRPSNAKWSRLLSSTGSPSYHVFSDQYCRPVPGDYDGDGKADPACWRWKNEKFYVYLSGSGNIESLELGKKGDIPVIGDFTGDGILDFTVYTPDPSSSSLDSGEWLTYDRAKGIMVPIVEWGQYSVPPDKLPKEMDNQF